MSLSKEKFDFIEECLNGYIKREERDVEASSCTSRSYYSENYARISEEKSRILAILDDLSEMVDSPVSVVGDVKAPDGFKILRFSIMRNE